ncbi:MAG: flagellar hook-length control protein FliK [Deltaproteobacteria bacterium]|nr:flagellar hook-length control protein FliK [Deltaproteobacteria bacterium]
MSAISMSTGSRVLDSILVSNPSGMDLAKGVSGKNEGLNLKSSDKVSEKFFDSYMKNQETYAASKAKKDEPVQTKEGLKSDEKSAEIPAEKSNVPASDKPIIKKSEADTSDDEGDDSEDTSVAQNAVGVSLPIVSPQLSLDVSTEGSNEELQSLPIENLLSKESLKPAATEMNEAVAKLDNSDLKMSEEIRKLIGEAKPATQAKTPVQAEDLSSEESVSSELEIKNLMNSDSQSLDVANASESEAPAKSLKHLVDGMFIQQNLENQNPENPNNASLALSFAKEVEHTFDVSAKSAVPEMVRTRLVNDMQPLVTKVLATNEGGEMSLSLRPANLGMVKIDVQVDRGQVKIDFQAEQVQSKALLQSQVGELKQQLHQAGLKVDEIKISTMQFEKTENASYSDRNPQQQSNRREQTASDQNSKRESSSAREFAEQLIETNEKRRAA